MTLPLALLALAAQTTAAPPLQTAPAPTDATEQAPPVQTSPAPSQSPAAPAASAAPLPPPGPGLVRVVITTSEGRITLDLEQARAPITTRNFLAYTDQHRLDGVAFYRAVKVGARFGFVQFGVNGSAKRALPPIAHEPSTQTGVKHTDGAISVARLAPGTARGDFTINLGDQPSLDAGSGQPADNLGYAAFGHVVEGMDVIERIMDSPTTGGPPFPGENLAAPVRVVTVRRASVAKAGSGGGT